VAADREVWAAHPAHDRWQEPVFRAFFADALANEGALVVIEKATGESVGSSRFQGYDPGADKLFDAAPFVTELKARQITPHIAINGTVSKLGKPRKTAVDGRTTRHGGYAISQRIRKRIEEAFGWAKTIGGIAKLKVRGLARADAAFTFRMIAYNLIRIPKLIAQPT